LLSWTKFSSSGRNPSSASQARPPFSQHPDRSPMATRKSQVKNMRAVTATPVRRSGHRPFIRGKKTGRTREPQISSRFSARAAAPGSVCGADGSRSANAPPRNPNEPGTHGCPHRCSNAHRRARVSLQAPRFGPRERSVEKSKRTQDAQIPPPRPQSARPRSGQPAGTRGRAQRPRRGKSKRTQDELISREFSSTC
jgi:hypothetical protein